MPDTHVSWQRTAAKAARRCSPRHFSAHPLPCDFNCHVGHTFQAETLLGEMSEELEGALWACVRMLTEKATLTRQLATRLRQAGQEAQATRVEEQAEADDRPGQLIRDTLLEAPSPAGTQLLVVGEAAE